MLTTQVRAAQGVVGFFHGNKERADASHLGGFANYLPCKGIRNHVQFFVSCDLLKWGAKLQSPFSCFNHCWEAPAIGENSQPISNNQKITVQEVRTCRTSATAQPKDVHASTFQSHGINLSLSYSERFVIRCYEVVANRRACIEAVANLLQEAACNHARSVGFSTDGFATTPSMRKRRLIWVTVRMHLEMDEYPMWGEEIEIETWFQEEGRVGTRRDWLVRNAYTQKIIGRATSTWVMMNQDSRRLSRVTDDIRADLIPFTPKPPRWAFEGYNPMSSFKIPLLNDSMHTLLKSSDLKPRRDDLDMNEHVNNVTYIGWMLESLQAEVLEKYDLHSITLEYRRECKQDDTVESISRAEYSSHIEADDDDVSRSTSKFNSKPALVNGFPTAFPVNGLSVDCTHATAAPDNQFSLKNGINGISTVARAIKESDYGGNSINSAAIPAAKSPSLNEDAIATFSGSSATSVPVPMNTRIQFVHLLRLAGSKIELNRGWSDWRLKELFFSLEPP
ncbi:hypothetical protein O6H91_05G127800 [Diphasiastrum complanatum]|uniref:Uncharacterized protein n=1 Tax=Diphasiastrum complanatum TaxID=34168 RepID=A0ACC2DT07_DIPCM|nr:hypothetical protein O6H91_05G127800 [Diphasiastrum complanatum]